MGWLPIASTGLRPAKQLNQAGSGNRTRAQNVDTLVMYSINVDPARKLVRVSLGHRFWSLATVAQYGLDCASAVRSLHCGPAEHLFLIDGREAMVQDKEVAAGLEQVLAAATAKKMAFVIGGGMASYQMKRIGDAHGLRIFEDLSEAEDWLFSK